MKLFVSARAVIVDADRILVLREAEYDEGTNKGKWDVPGGRINAEEPILDGLRREVMEECGLEVEIGEVLAVHENFSVIKAEDCHIIRVFYQVKPLSNKVILSGDHDKYEWMQKGEFKSKEFVSGMNEVFEKVL